MTCAFHAFVVGEAVPLCVMKTLAAVALESSVELPRFFLTDKKVA